MAELLKKVYTKNYVENLALKIKENYIDFDINSFIDTVFDENWKELELKERMRRISICFNDFLPMEYNKQLEILVLSKQELSYDESMALPSMVFQDFVEVFGLNDYDSSIKALEEFTINSSSEFAIRQFILKYEDKTMNQMKIWAKDSNLHIRRLASEGCRPRLPWAIALPKYKKDPSKVLEIIEILKNDKSKYVQKSVANNLNDISKDNPHLVIDFVAKNLGITKDLDWICKHASRTLLKKGEKKILELFGFFDSSHVDIIDFKYDTSLNIGDDLKFSFNMKSDKSIGNLRVEYIIYYLKSNGKHSSKVFMINQNEIKSKQKNFAKKQSFKNMTTRKHYAGEHFISIVLNGEEKLKRSFILNDTSN